jgi:hypothetical protein
MRSVAGHLTLAVVLFAAGAVFWYAGDRQARIASAEYTLVTLRYDRATTELESAADSGMIEPLLIPLGIGGDQRGAARYWSGDYEPLAQSGDPAHKLLAANATYRAVRAAGGPWQMVVGRMDAIAKQYADVLRTEPHNEDAAYNYEFILRLRSAVGQMRKPLPPADPADTGLTIHGVPGAPPEEGDAKKFRMIVPMMPDERQEAEEAGRAGRKIRRG